MPDVRKLEHVHLSVDSLAESLRLYEEVMGMEETYRENGVVYMGFPPTTHYDLIDGHYSIALEEGDPAVEHFAIRVTEKQLENAIDGLGDHGSDFEVFEGHEPGQERTVGFELPGGMPMELTVVETKEEIDQSQIELSRYQHSLISLDHITFDSTNVRKDATFVRDVLGFTISDVALSGEDDWMAAFTRNGAHHHDVAFLIDTQGRGQTTVNHVAWAMTNFDHIKRFLDVLGKTDYEVDFGPSRHKLGNNISLYFPDPSGHRIELTTEVRTLDPDTPTIYHNEPPNEIVTLWPGTHPPLDR